MEERKYIITVKATPTRSGGVFYYEQFGEDSHWSRIGKDRWEYAISENRTYAIETRFDDEGNIIWMRYKHDSERSWAKWGLRPTGTEHREPDGSIRIVMGFEKIDNPMPNKAKVA